MLFCLCLVCSLDGAALKTVNVCRTCVNHLQAAAKELSSKAPNLQGQGRVSGPGMDVDGDRLGQQHMSAQRAARCMQLLLEMIKRCRVDFLWLLVACQGCATAA